MSVKEQPRLEDLPDMVQVPQYAQWIGRGINQAYADVREGRVQSIRMGRKLYIPKRCLEKLAAGEGQR